MALSQAQKDFISKVGELAAKDMASSGILASLTTAQAILESGWGTSALATKANALFGIKADSRWNGRIYNIITKECYDNVTLTSVEAAFRAYDSWAESIFDHSAFLKDNTRYAAVVGETNYRSACSAIKAAGYATDPGYVEKLIRIIDAYELTAYDRNMRKEDCGMNINRKLCPAGLKNNPNRLMKAVNFITIHCTGNYSPTATAKSHADYQFGGSGGGQVSWHYTVDGKEIWQSFNDTQECWHAGDGSGQGNTASIGIEICVNDKAAFKQDCKNAAWLVATLMKRHNLGIDKVVQHNKWTGKNCPMELRSGAWGVTWEEFIEMVKAEANTSAALTKSPITETPSMPSANGKLYRVQVGAYSVKANADAMLDKLEKAGFEGYVKYE